MSAEHIRAHLARRSHPTALGVPEPNPSVGACIRLVVCSAIIFSVIWIIEVAIPVQPIMGVRNAFRCAIIMTFDWMTVDSPDLADIEDLSSSSSEVLCRQSWWQS